MSVTSIRLIFDPVSGFARTIPHEEEFVVTWRRDLPTNAPVPKNNEAFTQALRERALTKTPADKNNKSVTEAQLREVFNNPTNPKIVELPAAKESQGTANYVNPKPISKTGFTNFVSKHAKKLLGLGATALVVAAGIFSTQTRQNAQSNNLPAAKPAIVATAPVPQPIIRRPIANPNPALNDDTAARTANKIVETFIAPSKTGTERMELYRTVKGRPELEKIVGANANTPEEFTKRYELIQSARGNSPKGLTVQITLARELEQAIQKLSVPDRKAIESKFSGNVNTAFASVPTKKEVSSAQQAPTTPKLIKFFTQPMSSFGRAVFGRAVPTPQINISNYAGAHEMVRRTAAQAQQAGQQLSGTAPTSVKKPVYRYSMYDKRGRWRTAGRSSGPIWMNCT